MTAFRRLLLLSVTIALFPLTVIAQTPRPFVVEDPPRSPAEQQQAFHLPPGFQIELVASEPAIINPINLNFDAAGRLLVSQSVEYPIPDDVDQPGRDTIRRIVDTDNDGVPDKVSTFADKLHIPIGLTPVPGGVLGFSVPQLFFFGDADDDGTSEDREVRFGTFGFDDTHGMVSSLTWWIDGWVYGCHGFVNTSEIAGKDGDEVTMVSGNTYRLQPDGSRIEHYSYGQVNPFGLTIDPWGNVFTSDCHTRPATMLLRGAHYPRSPGDGLGHGPELMTHSHGSTGIAGIVSYWADQFPEEYQGSLLIGNPITGCVNQDKLEQHGSTFTAIEQPDFLTCDDFWFRPVDLQLGPDGALYIADMYNCIIGHYEVSLNHEKRDRSHGRIWRVSYVGEERDDSSAATSAASLDLTTASVDELIEHLADANIVVRMHATHQFVERIGAAAVAPIREVLSADSSETQRAHGVWVLQRTGALQETDWQPLLGDESPLVRLHVVKALTESADWDATMRDAVIARLGDDDAFVRRAAVDALGRHPGESSIAPLVQLLSTTDLADANLIHSARIALRDTLQEIDQFPELEERFAGDPLALSQLADVAVGIPHPQAAAFLQHRFEQGEFPQDRTADVLRHTIRYVDASKLPQIEQIADTYSDRDNDAQIAVASALVQGAEERGIEVPASIRQWAERLVRPLLTSDDVSDVQRGIELTSNMRMASLSKELLPLCDFNSPHPTERIPAIQALTATGSPDVATMLAAIIDNPQDNQGLRQAAAEKYANRKALRDDVLERLPSASQLIALGLGRGLMTDRDGVVALLDKVEQGVVTPRVLQDGGIQRLLPVIGQPEDVARFEKLTADMPTLDQRIQESIVQQRVAFAQAEPDPVHGEKLFRKTCALCHRLDNDGARVGPELDGIGQRGIDRLLEDILDPNRTVDKKYQATIVITVDGRVLTGLVTGEEGEVLLLTDQNGKPQRIPTSDIDERKIINGSAMPANVSELLKPAELHDLLAFLLTKTAKPKTEAAQTDSANPQTRTP